MENNKFGVVSSDSRENATMRFLQFASILLNLGGKVIVVPRFRNFRDAFIFFIRVAGFFGVLVTNSAPGSPKSISLTVLKQNMSRLVKKIEPRRKFGDFPSI